ncbi:hypothetical protein RHSP_83044 [Rhizobium freirei PRF 81]|uniref:Uncharacterized protein n=1 Tax=Rhizobium freirei PRF 81 TaxID=363754 RepID=N6V1A4_9HYPH|nr:hypothetical protein RHSP_83044 [Rhizobium freirei PRF 81]
MLSLSLPSLRPAKHRIQTHPAADRQRAAAHRTHKTASILKFGTSASVRVSIQPRERCDMQVQLRSETGCLQLAARMTINQSARRQRSYCYCLLI